jgi:hypothetical protein
MKTNIIFLKDKVIIFVGDSVITMSHDMYREVYK